MDLKLMLLGFS